MKISTQNSFGFIVQNHPVLKVNPQPITTPPPRLVPRMDVKKKA